MVAEKTVMEKFVIAIQASRNAHYETYIQVLDNLHAAYTNLRNEYSLTTYQISYSNLLKSRKTESKNSTLIKEKILSIQEKYPLLITDSELQN